LENLDWTKIIIAIITILFAASIVIKYSSKKSIQKQKTGNNCKNYQVVGDLKIKEENDSE